MSDTIDKYLNRQTQYDSGTDIANIDIEDYVPSALTRIYPYRAIFGSKNKRFIQTNTNTIVRISQSLFEETDGQEVSDFEKLKVDEDGNRYLDLFKVIDEQTKLTIASGTSSFEQDIRKVKTFTAITNNYIETDSDRPDFFTVGKPFNQKEYEDGKQIMYYGSSFTPSYEETITELAEDGFNIEDEHRVSEVVLQDVSVLEEQFDKSVLLFTTNLGIGKDVINLDGNTSGITLEFENHTLIQAIKAKGVVSQVDSTGNIIGTEFGEIDLKSKEQLAPFKMTPISVQDKLNLYADWFDYDVALPWLFAEKFKVGGSLSEVITNTDDRHMVEDMIIMSAGYAESWENAPRYTLSEVNADDNLTRSDVGKIKADFRIGHAGIPIQAIENKNPQQVVDGIYEKHLRRFPQFKTDKTRNQPTKAVIAALSRYITSSYSIGKGGNEFNQIYLPWFLEPFPNTPIVFENPQQVRNGIFSYLLTGAVYEVGQEKKETDVKFLSKSSYFREGFSDPLRTSPTSELILPKEVDLSNIKVIQTDRKITLPEVEENLSAIEKLPLPGDISTTSSKDMKYMFYLPIQDQTIFESFFVNTLTDKLPAKVGDIVDVQLPRGVDGKIWTQQEANEQVLKQQPGIIEGAGPVINNVFSPSEKTITIWNHNYPTGSNTNIGGYSGVTDDRSNPYIRVISRQNFLESVAQKNNIEDYQSIKITKVFADFNGRSKTLSGENEINEWLNGGNNLSVVNSGFVSRELRTFRISYQLSHSEFTTAQVKITSLIGAGLKFSYEDRQMVFDKQSWRRFLWAFNIIPNGFIKYNLQEKDDFRIEELDEIIIYSVWGNEARLQLANNGEYKIKLFNQDDESLAIQRITFY